MRNVYGSRLAMNFGPPLSGVIKALLLANIGVFILQQLFGGRGFDLFFGLVPGDVLHSLRVWQLGTYMFLHANLGHIFWNMFILWMFGSEISILWGRRAFLQYYFATGIGAGLIYLLIMPLIDERSLWSPLIGASGACFGVLTAFGLLFPERIVHVMLVFPVRVKYVVLGLGLIELFSVWDSDNVGHIAHLGGALIGVLYLRGGRALATGLGDRVKRWRSGRSFRVVDGKPRSGRPRNGGAASDRDEIDRILEKISREGLQSLTPREQETLRRASKH